MSLRYVDDKRYLWWKDEHYDAHESIIAAIRRLDDNQNFRRDLNLHHLRLYSNYAAYGLSGATYAMPADDGRIKMNAVKAVVDSALAQIGTVRTLPLFLTEKGNFSMKRRAKNLTKFIKGQFYISRHYIVGLEIFSDACIFGTGFQKITPDRGRITSERVFPDEIIVDDIESKYGNPMNLFQHKEVPREVVKANWPKSEQYIDAAERIRQKDEFASYDGLSESISLIEAWHLPDYGGGGGRHTICMSNATLLDEEWTRPTFPFATFRWSKRPLGFFGMGLAEELSDIQIEINYLLQKVQRLMTLSTSQIWVRKGSINKLNMSNEDWGIREYRTDPPVFMAPPAVSPEYFHHIDRLWDKAFEVAGISQLSATGLKPVGLDSGIALRTHQDIESKRFHHVQQRWDEFHLDCARLYIQAARELDEELPGGYRLHARSDKSLEMMDFSDVNLDEDKYQMQVFPTSLLPSTPTGKLQTLQELGQISPQLQQSMISQLDFPDVESAVSLVNAPIDMADLLIERMLEHGEYRPPEPTMDLQLTFQRVQYALLRADIEGAPEERLESMRRFLSESQQLLQAAQAVPPPVPGGPGAPPGAPGSEGPAGLPPGAPPPGAPPPGALPPGGGIPGVTLPPGGVIGSMQSAAPMPPPQ